MSSRIAILIFLFWLPAAAGEELSVDQAKAAYVFNFIKFTEWPYSENAAGGRITLCVMGNESLGDVLGGLDGRMAGTRRLHVMNNMQYGDDLAACQVVVVGESMRRKVAAILSETANAPVLTISAIEGFAEKGGCIGLLERENKMLFEINLQALRRKKLQLPGQVLNLAVNIYGK